MGGAQGHTVLREQAKPTALRPRSLENEDRMISITQAEQAMRHALDLAARGPATGENPQVGCVLLDSDGRIVAEGWHRGVGTPHAEVDALSRVDSAEGLTAVVTLEPCNHTAHTGPCSEALLAAGIAQVFYAVHDPSPVAGGGAARLAAAGIAVTGGILEAEAEEFQHKWLTATRLRRPYVTVKWASTLDGRAAAADGSSHWITGTAARQRVHEQREASDAILVGTGTVASDDPSLTARGDAGELMEHQPTAVVIGVTPVSDAAKVRQHPGGFIETGSRDLATILDDLFDRGIRRAYVEGGPTLASAFVAAGLADEFAIYLAPSLLGGDGLALVDIGVGSMAEIKKLSITSIEQLGNDLLITARPVSGPSTGSGSAVPGRDARNTLRIEEY
jgi:diaminohydroxyphosphoribosylaminopyrimidine deaminase/5-amino-6-(5-phosphoribosylamino)uracil reductase